jgi:hypothetical protein
MSVLPTTRQCLISGCYHGVKYLSWPCKTKLRSMSVNPVIHAIGIGCGYTEFLACCRRLRVFSLWSRGC